MAIATQPETTSTSTKSSINIRIDTDLKEKSEKVLDQMGLTMSSAINSFLHQVVHDQELPYKPSAKAENNEYKRYSDTISPEKLASIRESLANKNTVYDDLTYEEELVLIEDAIADVEAGNYLTEEEFWGHFEKERAYAV